MGLFGIGIAMILLPWVGYKDDAPLFGQGSGEMWLYIELGVVLIVKNICAVGGLSSVMLLVSLILLSCPPVAAINRCLDYELSAIKRQPGCPQWHRSDALRTRPEHWPFCFRCPLYSVDQHPPQGRGDGVQCLRRTRSLWLFRFSLHSERRPRER